jgi:hypothetical protein
MVEDQFRSDPDLPQDFFEELVREQDHLNRLTRGQMQAILNLEYMKALIGKPHSVPDPAAE